MELKKHISPGIILVGLYMLLFLVYIVVGLQPAEATRSYEITASLNIPSISLESEVTNLKLQDHELETPDLIVGSFSRAENKTLLIGHSSTVFQDLNLVKNGDEIIYNDTIYSVRSVDVVEKSQIDMNKLLAPADKDTLVIMTCAGKILGKDATHRLIVIATE